MRFISFVFIQILIQLLFKFETSAQFNAYQIEYIKYMKKFNEEKTIEQKVLLSLIPDSDSSYSSFYGLTYNVLTENEIKLYYDLENEFFDQALINKLIFAKILEMSLYVDGEYADSYFDDIERLIKINRNKFCEAFFISEKSKVKRLKEYSKKCK